MRETTPPPPADLAGLVAYLKSSGLPSAADALAQELAGLALGAAAGGSISLVGRPPAGRPTPTRSVSTDRLSDGAGGTPASGGPPSRSGSTLDLSPAASGSLGGYARARQQLRPAALPPPTLTAGLGPSPASDARGGGTTGDFSSTSPEPRALSGGGTAATSTAATPARPPRSPAASPGACGGGGVLAAAAATAAAAAGSAVADEYSGDDDPGFTREELGSTDDEWTGLRRTPSAGGGGAGAGFGRGGGGSRGSSLALAADAAEADIAMELYHAARASQVDLTAGHAAAAPPPPFRRQGSAARLHSSHPPSPPGPPGTGSGTATPARLVILAEPVLPSSASSAGLATAGSPPTCGGGSSLAATSRGASASPVKAGALRGSPARPRPPAPPSGPSPFAAVASVTLDEDGLPDVVALLAAPASPSSPEEEVVARPDAAATPPPPPGGPPGVFSFPITPPSEPVVAPSGLVFGSWPSFRRQASTSAWSSTYGSDEEGGGPAAAVAPPPPAAAPPHPPAAVVSHPGLFAGGHPLLWYGRGRLGSTDAAAAAAMAAAATGGAPPGRLSLDAPQGGRVWPQAGVGAPARPPSPDGPAAADAPAARAALGAGPNLRRVSGDLGFLPERSGGSFPGASRGGGQPATRGGPRPSAAARAAALLSLPTPPRGSPGSPLRTALPLAPGTATRHAGLGVVASSNPASPAHPPPPLARPPPTFDPAWYAAHFDEWPLRIVSARHRTGAESSGELVFTIGDLVAGRYVITDFLGGAGAFSTALQALDTATRSLVCLKVIKGVKDYIDQSLDEVRLLRLANAADPHDTAGILRLLDAFYHREHLFLVTEALRADLHAVARAAAPTRPPYFTLARVQAVARQVLQALAFLHGLGILHCDVKPENILLKSYSRCEVKLIDLGSSCLITDPPAGYVQSRAYRAPEVVLGCGYGPSIDVWSVGCVVAELVAGRVLLPSTSAAGLLARLEGLRGPVPPGMRARGRYAHRYYTPAGVIVERDRRTGAAARLKPKRTSLGARVPGADAECLSFLESLLAVDPAARPSAAAALTHPWLAKGYGAGAAMYTG